MIGWIGVSALHHVLKAAMQVDDAVSGDLQVVDHDGTALHLLVAEGLPDEHLQRFKVVRTGDGTTCAHVLAEGRRIVVRDVYGDEALAPHVPIAELGGWRSVQSMPLRGSSRQLVGVMSTFYRDAHYPSNGSLVLLDRAASIAGRMLELVRAGEALSAQRRDVRLSTDAIRALDALQVMVPMLAEAHESTLLDVISRHLDVVVAETTQKL